MSKKYLGHRKVRGGTIPLDGQRKPPKSRDFSHLSPGWGILLNLLSNNELKEVSRIITFAHSHFCSEFAYEGRNSSKIYATSF